MLLKAEFFDEFGEFLENVENDEYAQFRFINADKCPSKVKKALCGFDSELLGDGYGGHIILNWQDLQE